MFLKKAIQHLDTKSTKADVGICTDFAPLTVSQNKTQAGVG